MSTIARPMWSMGSSGDNTMPRSYGGTHRSSASIRTGSIRRCCICGSCSSRAWLRWKHDKYCHFFLKEGSLSSSSNSPLASSSPRSLCKACYERWRQWHVRHGISKETRNATVAPPSSRSFDTSPTVFCEKLVDTTPSVPFVPPSSIRITPIKPLPIRPVVFSAEKRLRPPNNGAPILLECPDEDPGCSSLPSPHGRTMEAVLSLMRLASSPPLRPPSPPSQSAPHVVQQQQQQQISTSMLPHVVDMLETTVTVPADTQGEPKTKRARIDLAAPDCHSHYCSDQEVDHQPQSAIRNWRWLHWDPTTKGYVEVGSQIQYHICSDESEDEDSTHIPEHAINVSS